MENNKTAQTIETTQTIYYVHNSGIQEIEILTGGSSAMSTLDENYKSAEVQR